MRLIDADVLEKKLIGYEISYPRTGSDCDYNDVMESIVEAVDDSETVDAVPVVHAKWIQDSEGEICCSNCGNYTMDMHDEGFKLPNGGWGYALQYPKYCSNCGARMDEDELRH